jgi:hypothetical protein
VFRAKVPDGFGVPQIEYLENEGILFRSISSCSEVINEIDKHVLFPQPTGECGAIYFLLVLFPLEVGVLVGPGEFINQNEVCMALVIQVPDHGTSDKAGSSGNYDHTGMFWRKDIQCREEMQPGSHSWGFVRELIRAIRENQR